MQHCAWHTWHTCLCGEVTHAAAVGTTVHTVGASAPGSLFYKDVVMHEDGTAIARLRSAGVVFLGTTNEPELGLAYVLGCRVSMQHIQRHSPL